MWGDGVAIRRAQETLIAQRGISKDTPDWRRYGPLSVPGNWPDLNTIVDA